MMAKRFWARLEMLDAAAGPHQITAPTYRLHPLSGRMAGWWSIRVSGNWRITFRFADGKAVDVDLVDYLRGRG